MRKITLSFITAFLFSICVKANNLTVMKFNSDPFTQRDTTFKFRLYPTQNIWTFLKLNTQTGQIFQVQFDLKGDNRFETILSLVPLVFDEKESIDGRFVLYPTQNIYTFIMIDQIDGRTWQVQWSTDISGRLVIPIEKKLQ
jgi:hypothetical protein